jgi:hypothetical protein
MLWVVDPTPERATSLRGRRSRADERSTEDLGGRCPGLTRSTCTNAGDSTANATGRGERAGS